MKKTIVFLDDELGSESTNFNPVLQAIGAKEAVELKTFSNPVDCFKFIEANRKSVSLVVSDYVLFPTM